MKEWIKDFDKYFVKLINIKMSDKKLDRYMYNITDKGGAIGSSIIAFVFLVISFFLYRPISYIGLEALLVLAINQIIVQLVKIIVKRKRPYDAVDGLNTFGIDMPDYSFPSGHTTASSSLATTLILNIPALWPLAGWFSLSIAISRIYLAVHYPTDVLAGFILGIGSSIIVHYYIFNPIYSVFINFIGNFI